MPPSVKYISQAKDYLNDKLPKAGKFILDKTITGCGATTYGLESDNPVVLISPRSNMLTGKHNDFKDSYLFRDPNDTNTDALELMERLKDYILHHLKNPFDNAKVTPPKILVTVDSAHYVLEVLEKFRIIDNFTFIVDEFHNLENDSRFKGHIDNCFLININQRAKNICYLSATPIKQTSLQQLTEFQNVDYYKLEWDPSVIIEPTIREYCMKKGETEKDVCLDIIQDFLSKPQENRFFAEKVWHGQIVKAREAVFYINEVRTISEIIGEAGLKPNDVRILVSPSNPHARELASDGFQINEAEIPRAAFEHNPNLNNKPFTFCTKANFEGRDFYSHSAYQFIFINGGKDWEALDPCIDIPQILGRQRLSSNPFRYDAVIYYKTKPTEKVMTKDEFEKNLYERIAPEKLLVDEYNNASGEVAKLKFDLAKKLSVTKDSYIDIGDIGNCTYMKINELKIAADYSLWELKNFYYCNNWKLLGNIQDMLKTHYGTKPDVLRVFESAFYKNKGFSMKMKVYADFLDCYPQYEESVLANPHIDREYHEAFRRFGFQGLQALDYDETKILNYPLIISRCQSVFTKGDKLTRKEVKAKLQMVYDDLQIGKTAKATDLGSYGIKFNITKPRNKNGKQEEIYEIC